MDAIDPYKNAASPLLQPPKKANDMQVGGKHYRSKYQHWDFVRDMKLDYFEGCATKYLTRRKNSRKEDLEKAKHFLTKRHETSEIDRRSPELQEQQENLVRIFCIENNLTYREYVIIQLICRKDYLSAIVNLESVIELEA